MCFIPREPGTPAASGPAVEWEDTPCLLCGSRHGAPLVEAPDQTGGVLR